MEIFLSYLWLGIVLLLIGGPWVMCWNLISGKKKLEKEVDGLRSRIGHPAISYTKTPVSAPTISSPASGLCLEIEWVERTLRSKIKILQARLDRLPCHGKENEILKPIERSMISEVEADLQSLRRRFNCLLSEIGLEWQDGTPGYKKIKKTSNRS